MFGGASSKTLNSAIMTKAKMDKATCTLFTGTCIMCIKSYYNLCLISQSLHGLTSDGFSRSVYGFSLSVYMVYNFSLSVYGFSLSVYGFSLSVCTCSSLCVLSTFGSSFTFNLMFVFTY